MRESRRQYYLHTLGVDSFMPRWVLPGAAVSSARPLEDSIEDSAAEVESETADTGSAAPVERGAAIVSALSETTSRPKTEPASSTESKAEPPLRFTLTAWRLSESLLVLDTRPRQLGLPTEALLMNMARALGYHLESLPKPDLLRWPLSDSSGGVEDARAMVGAYLEAQQQRQPAPYLLLMGATAARFALPAEDWPSDNDARQVLGHRFSIPDRSQEAIVVPSLAAMLQKPALKAVAWEAMQPLRRPGDA